MTIAKFPFWRVVPSESGREGEYILPITRPATVGPPGNPHIMGGACLGAAVDALELSSQQPLLWATIQFRIPSQGTEELTIRCDQVGGGRSIGQWQADVILNGRVIQMVTAAVGAREPCEQVLFAKMPDVPPPDDCPEKPKDANGFDDNLPGQLERRTALEDNERGIEAVWSRSKAGFANDAGLLAVISDFFLGAHPRAHGGSSLDATFRFIQSAPPGWVLSVTDFAAFDRGVAHGSGRHFSEDGTLLAISSQTGVVPRVPLPDLA